MRYKLFIASILIYFASCNRKDSEMVSIKFPHYDFRKAPKDSIFNFLEMKFENSTEKFITNYYSNFLVESSNNKLILFDTRSKYSWNFTKTKENNDLSRFEFELFDVNAGYTSSRHKLLADKNNLFFILNGYQHIFLFKLTKYLIPEEAVVFWKSEEAPEDFNRENYFCYFKINYFNCNYNLYLIKNILKPKNYNFNLKNVVKLFEEISNSDSLNLYANYIRSNCSNYLVQFMEVEQENLFEYDSLILLNSNEGLDFLYKKN